MRQLLGTWLPAATKLESGKEKAIVPLLYSNTVLSVYEHDKFQECPGETEAINV